MKNKIKKNSKKQKKTKTNILKQFNNICKNAEVKCFLKNEIDSYEERTGEILQGGVVILHGKNLWMESHYNVACEKKIHMLEVTKWLAINKAYGFTDEEDE